MDQQLERKIEAEYRLRELLRSEGMPQPDEVEYGHACVRFYYHESKTCVVIDLPGADDDLGSEPRIPDDG